jgi:hypothetical protein
VERDVGWKSNKLGRGKQETGGWRGDGEPGSVISIHKAPTWQGFVLESRVWYCHQAGRAVTGLRWAKWPCGTPINSLALLSLTPGKLPFSTIFVTCKLRLALFLCEWSAVKLWNWSTNILLISGRHCRCSESIIVLLFDLVLTIP